MMRPETKSVPPEIIKLIPVDLCISICVNVYFAYIYNNIYMFFLKGEVHCWIILDNYNIYF